MLIVVSTIAGVSQFVYARRIDFFILTSQLKRGYTDQLVVVMIYLIQFNESVNYIASHKQSLSFALKPIVQLNQPIDQDFPVLQFETWLLKDCERFSKELMFNG